LTSSNKENAMTRRVLFLMFVCLASCKHTSPPDPPPPNGLAIDAPFFHLRKTNAPERPVNVDETGRLRDPLLK
jgi:hypothetical protein